MRKIKRLLLVMLAIAMSLSTSSAVSFAASDDWDEEWYDDWELTSDNVFLDDVVYNGKYQTGNLSVEADDGDGYFELEKGVDYKVSYSNNKNVGTATVVVTGIGDYTGKVTAHFKIKRASLKNVSAASISPKTYSGKTKKPAVTLKYKGNKLVKGRDYSIIYRNNRNVGKAKVVIKGKGNYTGTKTLSFKIRPKGTTMSSVSAATKGFTAKWNKQSARMSASRISGYQVQYSTSSTFAKNKHTYKVSGYSKLSKKVTGLTGGKKYYVRVRTYKKVNGVTYYSAWSSKKSVTTKKAKKSSSGGSSTSRAAGSVSGGTVYWTPSGSVYHYSINCPTLSRSRTIYSGTIAQSGLPRGCYVCGH